MLKHKKRTGGQKERLMELRVNAIRQRFQDIEKQMICSAGNGIYRCLEPEMILDLAQPRISVATETDRLANTRKIADAETSAALIGMCSQTPQDNVDSILIAASRAMEKGNSVALKVLRTHLELFDSEMTDGTKRKIDKFFEDKKHRLAGTVKKAVRWSLATIATIATIITALIFFQAPLKSCSDRIQEAKRKRRETETRRYNECVERHKCNEGQVMFNSNSETIRTGVQGKDKKECVEMTDYQTDGSVDLETRYNVTDYCRRPSFFFRSRQIEYECGVFDDIDFLKDSQSEFDRLKKRGFRRVVIRDNSNMDYSRKTMTCSINKKEKERMPVDGLDPLPYEILYVTGMDRRKYVLISPATTTYWAGERIVVEYISKPDRIIDYNHILRIATKYSCCATQKATLEADGIITSARLHNTPEAEP